jgi:hypothetical protein
MEFVFVCFTKLCVMCIHSCILSIENVIRLSYTLVVSVLFYKQKENPYEIMVTYTKWNSVPLKVIEKPLYFHFFICNDLTKAI